MPERKSARPEVPRGRQQRGLRWLVQYLKFGTVGGAATGTHVLVYVGMIEGAALRPLVANVVAFCAATGVSFLGHFYWTFRDETSARIPSGSPRHAVCAKFVLSALIGFALNALGVYVVVDVLALPYLYAPLLMVSVVPLLVFVLNKWWVFR